MKKFSSWISNHSLFIVILSVILLVPAFIGYEMTRINYDILIYLPESVDTIKGENILTDDFGLGSYAFVMTDDSPKEIATLEKKIQKIEGVNEVFSLIDVVDTTIPKEMLPSEITSKLYHDNETIIMVTFDGSTSEDGTIEAVRELRELVADANKVSSMTSMVIDTMDLSNNEIFIYVVIAVILCIVVLIFATDSYIVPIFLLANIGIAILYNMGSNIIFGQISYITKAISAVLQLGVTTDFSIFLYHKYQEKKENSKDKREAMALAIEETFKSVIGSSLTTFAGFLALCTMDLTLGTDIGLVMAKGIVWGLICVLTLFPSLLLVFDKAINKTKHRKLLPSFNTVGNLIIKHQKVILGLFVILMIPAIIGNAKYEVYYKLDDALPDNLPFKLANTELAEKFGITSPELILLDKDIKPDEVNKLTTELKNIKGIDLVLSPSVITSQIPSSLFPSSLANIVEHDKYQLMILNSTYEIASDELNNQIEELNTIVKKYDEHAIIAGEGALMKDLVTIADHDFKMVNYTSIIIIFIIMILVLKQIGLPIILVFTIEFAIFLNMAFAYFTGEKLPFIASIVVGTIQLGATIDYAILMSTRYLEERGEKNKTDAMRETLKFTIPSIITSAFCFFAATFGVAIYTKIDMIGAIVALLARGSIISMLVVIFILPTLLLLFDTWIVKKKEGKTMRKKVLAASLLSILLLIPANVSALEKKETVYTNLDATGDVITETVNTHLHITEMGDIEDTTELSDILNLTGTEKFELNQNKLKWKATAQDIMYRGYSKKENPLTFAITYYLDKEEIKVEDLLGKSGDIKVEIKITNNSYTYKHGKKIYTPFITMLGTYFDTENNSNVKITNGRVINTGTRSMVVGLASPGLYESTNISELKEMDTITITYTTKEFKLNDYYLVSSPKLLEETDFAIFNKMDTLTSSIDLLGENMNQIDAGAKMIASKVPELKNGTETISTSLKTALTALKEFDEGSTKLDDSLKEVLSALKGAQANLMDKDLEGSLTSLTTLKSGNESAITTLSNTNTNIKKGYDTYTSLVEKGTTLGYLTDTSSSDQIKTVLQSLLEANVAAEFASQNITKTQDEITALASANLTSIYTALSAYENGTYTGNQSLIYLLTQNNKAIDSTITNLTDINTELTTLITELSSALQQIEEGSNKLSNGLTELRNGIHKLYQGSILVDNGTSKLNTGVQELSTGISKFNQEGIQVLVNKTSEIKKLETTLKDLVQASKDYNG